MDVTMKDITASSEPASKDDGVVVEQQEPKAVDVSDDSVVSSLSKDSGKSVDGPVDMDVEENNDQGSKSEDELLQDVYDMAKANVGNDSNDFEDEPDVLDLEKLYELLEQSKSAGNLIAGKNVLLLIGGTGAGKTTTTLYLAGVKFEEVDVYGKEHYEPRNIPNELTEFAVSGRASSVTKTIHATTVTLPNGEEVTICDTPGFGDTKGTEMEISNGLGIIHALKRAASVKPVLVLNHKEMDGSRYAALRKTLNTVIDMMGHRKDFSAFEYIFTRCEGREIKRVHRQLDGFRQQLRESPKDILGDHIQIKEVLDALLSDMVTKSNPVALSIDPMEPDEAPQTLEELWSNSVRMERPGESFVEFISQDASNKLDRQVNSMLIRMDKALKADRLEIAACTLRQLCRLASMLPLPQIEKAQKESQMKALDFWERVQAEARSLVDRMAKETDFTDFEALGLSLRSKLSTMLDTCDLIGLCQGTAEGQGKTEAVAIVKHLAVTIESPLHAIGSDYDQICQSQDLLQGVLLRVVSLQETLGNLVGEFGTTSAKIKVSNIIQGVLASIPCDVQQSLKAETLDEWRARLLFLLDTSDFLKASGISIDCMDTMHNKLREALDCLASKGETSLEQLDETITKMKEVNDANSKEDTTELLETLSSTEFCDMRKFSLALLSSSRLLSKIFHASDRSEENVRGMLEEFNVGAHSFISGLSESLQFDANEVMKKTNTQSVQNRIKLAQGLSETVKVTCEVCMCSRSWADYGTDLNEHHMALYAVQKELDQFIEAKKRLPSGPEPLLYGPDVLGQQWYNMLVELRAFKIKHGHCKVPRKYKQQPSLGRWVNNQRYAARQIQAGKYSWLNDKRIEALDDLDFVWNMKK